MTTVIEVRGLHKEYGDTVAVDDVSFTVSEGEIFGILGPNGAGKTTTVECVEGLRKPDRGELRCWGSTRRGTAPPLALAWDGHLAEQGPVVLRDREVDDPRGVRQVRRQVPLRRLEVRGVDVRPAGLAVPEGLHQDVLVRVGDAAGPVEPQAARLVPRRLGELGGDLRPPVGVLGPDLELGRNEDHQSSCLSRRRRFVRPSSYG